jgi:hypothetical protein
MRCKWEGFLHLYYLKSGKDLTPLKQAEMGARGFIDSEIVGKQFCFFTLEKRLLHEAY